jgi:anti-sigma B factor antagonist
MGRIETYGSVMRAVAPSVVGRGGESTAIISLIGQVDMYLASELMQRTRAAIEQDAKSLVFDLTAASFIDSTTLGSLVSAHKQLRARGGRIGVVCPSPEMARIFSITGLDQKFPVEAKLTDLLKVLQAPIGSKMPLTGTQETPSPSSGRGAVW